MPPNRRRIVLLFFALIASVLAVYLLTTPGKKPVVVSVYEPPIISVENRVVDIGKVESGSQPKAHFILYNIGGQTLRVKEVSPSCGCTVAQLSKKTIAPGDFTQIDTVLDTRLKQGKIRKQITVYSNAPQRPELALFLTGEVLAAEMAGHKPITLKPQERLILFQGKCASCHVQQGVGKTGKALFLADCAMCHGANAQGNHSAGPSLLQADYENAQTIAAIRTVIAEGSKRSPQMPPFSKKLGGPLTDDEIDSLVGFLKFQSKQAKLGLLKQSDVEAVEDEAAFEQALKQPH